MLVVAATTRVSAAPLRRLIVDAPAPVATAAKVSPVIYLERCRGGCRVTGGDDDAAAFQSRLANSGIYTVSEFQNAAGQTGAAADAEWDLIVRCMKEVYSPFAVEITDQRPAAGTYHVAVVAGSPPDLGYDLSVLGVAPLAGNCAPLDNVMSFSFANAHHQTDVADRVINICWTAAQESAHAFGLDHEFEFVHDGRSACTDAMTYRFDCGGQRFFRNAQARCGEDAPRACKCSGTQNSHKKLLSVFGPGTPITTPPELTLTNPPPGTTELPANVIVTASAQRGIAKVELFLNGFPMVELAGRPFGPLGQPEDSYGLLVPADAPDSVYDLFVRASDDLGVSTDTPVVTVTKGGPCTSADACLADQQCVDGRCQWPPAVGELGESCTYPQFCKSLVCAGADDQAICTERCEPEDPTGCPDGMSCQADGICLFADDSGGCCSAAAGSGWRGGGLALVVLGLVLRRRTKSRR